MPDFKHPDSAIEARLYHSINAWPAAITIVSHPTLAALCAESPALTVLMRITAFILAGRGGRQTVRAFISRFTTSR